MSDKLRYDITNLSGFVNDTDLAGIEREILEAHKLLQDKNGPGSDFLGWMDLPGSFSSQDISEIDEAAASLDDCSDLMVVIGIGGSYLGAKALIESVCPPKQREKIVFAGFDICGSALQELIEKLETRDFSVNVISKSGTTTEPAIAFRMIESLLLRKYGPEGAAKRVICTTDKDKGALRQIATQRGYRSFVIPRDVGGRFSVLSPVGLLPAAMAGVDIRRLLEGALEQKEIVSRKDMNSNPACLYAAVRNALWRKGKVTEIFSVFENPLRYVAEWWKQLFGESEGKQGKGIFPAGCVFSTDLHSMGQFVQEGNRNIFETFLIARKGEPKPEVPREDDDADGLNYIAGMSVDEVNKRAYEATAKAHCEGGVPNSTIFIEERSAFCLGALFYFLETAVAVSGYVLGVNPFDQPGVEAYKKEMFRLLGKPGID